ncbi:hypothetical protein ACFWNG_08005 [Streptomyces sp. NPDC058391]|uniref:hypothetical protein n=1 Tax=Streptomyces sp. NPDC058391 TaxID=3346476 RepID=UPI00365B2A4C
MTKEIKLLLRSTLAVLVAVVGCLALTTPQAVAINGPSAGVKLNAGANADTRAVAAADPQAAQAAAVECGTGYELRYAERLPTAENRLGTLFSYTKMTGSRWDACAIFDNNTGATKYMKLKICPNTVGGACAQDEGNFSQYAGPVHLTNAMCGDITAIMKNTSSSSTSLINAIRGATACN